REHNTIASIAVVALMAYTAVNEWLLFFFPGASVFIVVYAIVLLGVVAAAIVAHLAVAGATRERRIRAAVGTVVVAGLLSTIAAPVREDRFSDTPKFQAQIKPVSAGMVPAQPVSDFIRAMNEARVEADKAVKPDR